MLTLKRFAHIDFFAGVAAAAFAVAVPHVPALQALASVEVAASFSLLALGRWYAGTK